MMGYVVYLAVQEQTTKLAHQALPGAAHQLDADIALHLGRNRLLRWRLSLALRSLADRVEPRPIRGDPRPAGFR